MPGGTTRNCSKRALRPLQEGVALDVALVLDRDVFVVTRRRCRTVSKMTEWSITSSTGTKGLIFFASLPSATMASRMAAKSTTAGTPVRSCIRTRAGVKAISRAASPAASPCPEGVLGPSGQGFDVLGRDLDAIFLAQQVLEQHLDGVGEALDTEGRQAVGLE